MVVVVLLYPACLPTFDEIAERCRAAVPVFEKDVPGLIDKTWGMNEEKGRMCSVYHFEDLVSAEAWFNSERQRSFRAQNNATLEYFDVAAVAFLVLAVSAIYAAIRLQGGARAPLESR